MKLITKKLMRGYYLMLAAAVLLAILMYFLVSQYPAITFHPLSAIGQAIQSIVIAYMLIAVPAALFIVTIVRKHSQKKHWEKRIFVIHYYRVAMARVILMGLGISLGIIAYYLLQGYMSMLYCAGIAAIGLIFTKPNAGKVEMEISGVD